MTCGVYKISFSNTDKVYVGSSKDIEKRIKQHKMLLDKGVHHSYKLQRFYNSSNNKEIISFDVLEETRPEDRIIAECKFIYDYKAIAHGFNVAQPINLNPSDAPALPKINNLVFPISFLEDYEESSLQPAIVYSYMLCRFATLTISDDTYCETVESIASNCKVSVSGVKRAISFLTKNELVKVVKGGAMFNSNGYCVVDKYGLYSD